MTQRLMETGRVFEYPVTEEVGKTPRHRAHEFGESGLAAFTLMEMVDSPWQDIRESLEARVVDQQAAITAIIDALDGSEARLMDDHRPKANLAFLGPTGVGKSETAKSLADLLGQGDRRLIKIDCSNFSQGHEVAGLVGSPVGYVGYGQKPVFNKDVVESPGTVVLFDEIEKGSPELFDLMLQIMGDGHIQLSNGDLASFRNAIVIMTSNLGAKEMSSKLSQTQLGFTAQGATTDKGDLERVAKREFTEFFRPEFINRLDRMVVFHPLSKEGLGRVLDTKVGVVNQEYEPRLGVRLTLSDATKEHLIAEASTELHMGARPLIRSFENHVQTTFGRYLGSGNLGEGTHVRVFHASELATNQVGEVPLVFASAHDPTIRKIISREVVPVAYEESTDVLDDSDEYEE